MPAVGITDHGSMAGAIELYRCAGKAGVKPLLGCEIYLVDDRRARQHSTQRDWNHLTLLAETTEGYHNLIKLCTLGYLEGYYYKPRVDYALLEQYADGIIALSGCLSGRTCQALLAGDTARAREELDRLVQIFGREDVYIELQDAGIDEHRTVNPGLLSLAAETGLPVVGTGDVHYLRAEDAQPHEALLCIQTNDLLSNPNRFRFSTQDFYLKTSDEMSRSMAPWGGDVLLAPTLEIAERCNVVLDLDRIHLPRFDEAGDDSFGMLRRLCEQGMLERYGTIEQSVRDRLEFELQTIREMGFADYFLIVWDFVRFAKANGVSVGPGRGSAAGSIVAYALRITDLDPLRYDLLFERFLNPGRKTMPDIDIDFSVHGRERVIAYVTEKYGRERVAQIITFSKLAAKASVRDAGRVMGLPYGAVDRIAKLVPEGVKVGFEESLKPNQELRKAYDEDELVRQVVDMARPLEGLVRADSIHAAGVVIGDRPLVEYLPLQQKGADSELVTQYPMGDVEALGLLKMDFLGPAQPRCDRRGRAHHPRVGRDRSGRPLGPAAGRPAHLRHAGARRHPRRLPVRVERHARRAAAGQADRVRGSDRARRALPPGPDGQHPGLRQAQERPRAGHLPRSAARADPEHHAGRLHLPGAGDADRQGPGRIQPRRGRRPAQGDLQEGARADGLAAREVPRRLRGQRRRAGRGRVALGRERAQRRLLVQQGARGLLRDDRLPHGLPQGQPSRALHGGADLVRDADQGQGAVLRQRLRRDGHRGAPARRQQLGPGLPGRRGPHPLRPERGQGRGGGRGARHRAGARRGRAVHDAVGLLRARGRPADQQARAREPGQVRRLRFHGRDARRDAGGARGRGRRRAEDAGRPARRAGLDLRPRATRRTSRSAIIRRSSAPSWSARSCSPSRRRRSGCT